MTPSFSCKNCGHSLIRPDIQLQQTPFNEILQSNSSVPSSSIDQISSTVSVIQDFERELDTEIHHIQGVLTELLAKRTALHSQAERLTALHHPIRRMPSELLAEIYLQCIDTPWMHDIGSGDYPVTETGDNFGQDLQWAPGRFIKLGKMPLVLSSVCALWRRVAIATSELWASISLVIEPTHEATDLLLMGLWLERAREMPLFICLTNLDLGNHFDIISDLTSILNLFVSRSEQWRAVDLLLPFDTMQHLSSIRNRLSKLEWLSIGSSDDLDEPMVMSMFEVAPQLVSFQLAENLWPVNVVIPWAQLRHCDLGCTGSPQEYLDVLHLMPALETCRMHIAFGHDTFNLNSAPLQLRHLRSLTLNDKSVEPKFLSFLTAPALRHFSMKTLSFTPEAVSYTLAPWIKSHNQIQRLTLGSDLAMGRQDSRQFMLSLLEGVPDLQQLHVLGKAASDILNAPLTAFNVLSRLQVIIVDYELNHYRGDMHMGSLDISKFLDDLSSRIGTGLRRVEIRCNAYEGQSRSQLKEGLESELPVRLAELRSAGLDITMTYLGLDFFDETAWA
ncbi:hypothetical protein HWV62_35849 [Athelia sp. TMB]|nr:hypothetical protein HWV62_35849 [Athelia sp. TMB]